MATEVSGLSLAYLLWHIGHILFQLTQRLEDIAQQRASADNDVGLPTHPGRERARATLQVDFRFGQFNPRFESWFCALFNTCWTKPSDAPVLHAVALIRESVVFQLD